MHGAVLRERRIAARFFYAAVSFLLLVAACREHPRPSPLPSDATVVALGDSLTFGTGAPPEASYPAVLAQLTGWTVVNAGIPGETAAQGCARMVEVVAEHHPRMVMVLLGGNDFLRRTRENDTREALARCARGARQVNVPMVLIPVPRVGALGLGYPTLYDEVARSHDIPLIDAGLSRWLAQAEFRSDAVHLNAKGYRQMALRIADGLCEAGFLRN